MKIGSDLKAPASHPRNPQAAKPGAGLVESWWITLSLRRARSGVHSIHRVNQILPPYFKSKIKEERRPSNRVA